PILINIRFIGFYTDDLRFPTDSTATLSYDIEVAIAVEIIHAIIVDISYTTSILNLDGFLVISGSYIDHCDIDIGIKIIKESGLGAVQFPISKIGVELTVFNDKQLLADGAEEDAGFSSTPLVDYSRKIEGAN